MSSRAKSLPNIEIIYTSAACDACDKYHVCDHPSLVIGFKMSAHSQKYIGTMFSLSKLPPPYIMCNVLWAMPIAHCPCLHVYE